MQQVDISFLIVPWSHIEKFDKSRNLRLPSLEDTFPISMAQGLPLLNEVVLENLPQFKGRDGNEIVLTLSSLQKLELVDYPELTPFIISTKIQLFDSSYNLSSLKFLNLFELTELRVIWNGPIKAVNFQNLNLPRLSELYISDC
ncbi:hypothetical protein Goklo_025207 [Gossypium klotzschianum]|uniref:Uncharacterized protein n=1 Tax=Gossypium klotzschianum TaxID=34286 RepID=A0A7J8W4X1_9ROSI|nr:hypothetical protein [Gossypium klotzschianum]